MTMPQTLLIDSSPIRNHEGVSLRAYIAVDAATGKMVSTTLTSKGAVEALRNLLSNCSASWGMPSVVWTDNGREYGAAFCERLAAYGIQHRIFHPASDQEFKGKIERVWRLSWRSVAVCLFGVPEVFHVDNGTEFAPLNGALNHG